MILIKPFVALLVIFAGFHKRLVGACQGRYQATLLFLVLLLIAGSLIISRGKKFEGDEIEHIHTVWYVEQGRVPFKDFFQHHNPLLWYSLVPVLKLVGHRPEAAEVFRLCMIPFFLGMIWLAWRIALRASGSREIALLSLGLLLSLIMFVKQAVEIRPDVPQSFLGLLSFYLLLRYLERQRAFLLLFSGLAAGLSFLFLQKMVFLLFAYGLLFPWLLYRRRMTIKAALLFSVAAAVPVALFAFHLYQTRSFSDYVLTNYLLNLNFARAKRFHLMLQESMRQNLLFWLIALPGAILALLRKGNSEAMRITMFVAMMHVLLLIPLRRVHAQYCMPALPMLSLAGAWFLVQLFEAIKAQPVLRLATVLVILSQPLFHMNLNYPTLGSNRKQLKLFKSISKYAAKDDFVYDGGPKFNLFHKDLHYFWYSLKTERGLETYNKLTDNRFGSLDLEKLILEKRPAIISDHLVNPRRGKLAARYYRAKEGYFVRRDILEGMSRAKAPQ